MLLLWNKFYFPLKVWGRKFRMILNEESKSTVLVHLTAEEATVFKPTCFFPPTQSFYRANWFIVSTIRLIFREREQIETKNSLWLV